MRAKTYDEWREIGYQVKKGEKATGWDAKQRKPTFTREQVESSDNFDRKLGVRFHGDE